MKPISEELNSAIEAVMRGRMCDYRIAWNEPYNEWWLIWKEELISAHGTHAEAVAELRSLESEEDLP